MNKFFLAIAGACILSGTGSTLQAAPVCVSDNTSVKLDMRSLRTCRPGGHRGGR